MKLRKEQYAKLLGLGTILLFFATRLYNLLAIPIFTDESIYIRWTQIFRHDPHQLFISLTDGKQPLFVWVASVPLRCIHDPLLAGRLVSVLTGFLTMLGLYFLTRELFGNKRTALVTSFLYVIYPFALLYDKLALYDSMLAMFAVWSLYLEILLVKRKTAGIAILTGLVIGGGLLTKSSAFFFLYLIPFSLMLFDFKAKKRNKDFLKWGWLALVAAAIAMACYSILRFSPYFAFIASKNSAFVYPLHEWIRHPFTFLIGNTHILLKALVGYSTIPLLAFAAAAFFAGREFTREKVLLLAWFTLPFTALALFGNDIYLYPRYILFMTMPLLMLTAFSVVELLEKIKPRYLQALLILILVIPIAHKDYFILTDFTKATIPQTDREQLITGFASGVGVQRTVTFLKQQSKDQKIYIGTQSKFGLMPDALQDYLDGNPNTMIEGYWPIENKPPQTVLDAAKTMPTYFVFYAPCSLCEHSGAAPKSWPLKLIFRHTRLDKSFYSLYQVVPQ